VKPFSIIIIVVSTLRLFIFPGLELGHALVHALNTNLHRHTAQHSHTIKDHHIDPIDENQDINLSQAAHFGLIPFGYYAYTTVKILKSFCNGRPYTAFILFYQPPALARSHNPPCAK